MPQTAQHVRLRRDPFGAAYLSCERCASYSRLRPDSPNEVAIVRVWFAEHMSCTSSGEPVTDYLARLSPVPLTINPPTFDGEVLV